MNAPKPPKELDAAIDVILAYRPKPKTKPAKKRRRMQKRLIAAQTAVKASTIRKSD
jgi:hypothetical protein